MRNLRRITEVETARVAAEEAFRTSTAATFAVGSSVMAFLGMLTRYEAGAPTPVPGMGDLVGQIGWSVGLGASMFATWWLTPGTRLVARARP